ncbi:hypothetical protein WAX74_09250 [Psychrobacillus sp. FJAT-51614]|uniref:Uncharacterized protein n=1 Tax=Psychrobacillus mangrovi TaxID=3117745 RepID=A0ABU8F499_9BACI
MQVPLQQVADSVHRMGQQVEVHIIRLIAKDTIEKNALQHKKKSLIEEVIKSGQYHAVDYDRRGYKVDIDN